MDTLTIIILVMSIITLITSIGALVLAIGARRTTNKAMQICVQNANELAKIMAEKNVKPDQSWVDIVCKLAGPLLQAAPFILKLVSKT